MFRINKHKFRHFVKNDKIFNKAIDNYGKIM